MSEGNDMQARVWNALERDTFTFSPTVAFHINKPESPEKRRIETIVDEDYLVQRFLLRIIHSPMDKIFEESSMGYRGNKRAQEVEKKYGPFSKRDITRSLMPSDRATHFFSVFYLSILQYHH